MNIVNNKRKKDSQERIKKAFIKLLEAKEINEINVTDIVKLAGINRSTFYANYLDIYDLADKMRDEMFENVLFLYKDQAKTKTHSYDYLKLFEHIKDNQPYYKTLFKLNFDFTKYYDIELEKEEAIRFFGTDKYIDYHIEYFKAGINAIMRKWLDGGCVESPNEVNNILITEYSERKTTK